MAVGNATNAPGGQAAAGGTPAASRGERLPASVPDWYPAWAKEMADLFFAGNTCLFVLHGNVNDFVRTRTTPAPPVVSPSSGQASQPNKELGAPSVETQESDAFCGLMEFVSGQIFGSWDAVVSYDLGRGIQAEAGPDPTRLQEMMKYLSAHWGGPNGWTRDPDQVLDAFDRLIQRNLLQDDPAERKRIALLFPYAQYMVPSGEHSTLARGPAARLVRFLSWAQNPYIKRVNMAFCLVAEALNEVNSRLVQNPHVATIEVTLPSDEIRRCFIRQQFARLSRVSGNGAARASVRSEAKITSESPPLGHFAAVALAEASASPGLTVDAITQLSNGLNLVNLNVALSRSGADGQGLDVERFRNLKKGLIERQCQDLVTFIEPGHKLDLVVGHAAAKERLRQDAQFIAQGILDAAPMGYLICGPVGTGKSFLAECYAGSIGIPCLVLRNFRSKYVGETEGNLEKVLTVLRSLGPVVVIVDEADAALGNREMGGDSGTSSRVFSMIASQMGNTKFRGRIIWMLLTSRPELLPIDLKRQGRAEVHIPLFYPEDEAEIHEMFSAMARKNKVQLCNDAIPKVSAERRLSGADIESVVLNARRSVLSAGRAAVERKDLQEALESFIPSAQGLEKELQEMAAVLECTDRKFLPREWQENLKKPDARARLQERMVAIQQILER
jgi:AAA+ superfamily predicted ATPase